MTDEGVRGVLLDALQPELENRKTKLAKLREQKAVAQLEDLAQSALSVADITLLSDAGIIDKQSAVAIQARIDTTRAEIDAIQRFRQALRAVT